MHRRDLKSNPLRPFYTRGACIFNSSVLKAILTARDYQVRLLETKGLPNFDSYRQDQKPYPNGGHVLVDVDLGTEGSVAIDSGFLQFLEPFFSKLKTEIEENILVYSPDELPLIVAKLVQAIDIDPIELKFSVIKQRRVFLFIEAEEHCTESFEIARKNIFAYLMRVWDTQSGHYQEVQSNSFESLFKGADFHSDSWPDQIIANIHKQERKAS